MTREGYEPYEKTFTLADKQSVSFAYDSSTLVREGDGKVGSVDDLKVGDGAAPLVERVDRQSTAIARMLEDLLDASRIAFGKVSVQLEPLELRGLLTEALADAGAAMKPREFEVRLDLRLGKSTATILTCDLSYDYVRINAEYTT